MSISKNIIKEVSTRLVCEKKHMAEWELTSPEAVVKFLHKKYEDWDREVVLLLNLNTRLMPINYTVISIGSVNESSVDVSACIRSSILSGAANVILLHNHPTGNCTPSKLDTQFTDRLIKAYSIIGIHFADHIVLGDNQYFSFVKNKKLNYPNLNYESEANNLVFKVADV